MILAGAFTAYAYSTSNPSYFGHSGGEINGISGANGAIYSIDSSGYFSGSIAGSKVLYNVKVDNADKVGGYTAAQLMADRITWKNNRISIDNIENNAAVSWADNAGTATSCTNANYATTAGTATSVVSLGSNVCIRVEGDAHADYYACGCGDGTTQNSKTAPGSVGKVCFVANCNTYCP